MYGTCHKKFTFCNYRSPSLLRYVCTKYGAKLMYIILAELIKYACIVT